MKPQNGLQEIPDGAMTALITPMTNAGEIDWDGLAGLVDFQGLQGISAIVSAGTTAQASMLTQREHELLNFRVLRDSKVPVIGGCGSNCVTEALHYAESFVGHGGRAILAVDPYYVGPSSLEIANEYYAVLAEKFPDVVIVPYIIPGRTGCELSVVDLADLSRRFRNIRSVKEATGNLDRMILTRQLVGPDFRIISGDDDKTFEMMANPKIAATGVISVASNIAPAAVQEMCQAILLEDFATARVIRDKLQPLFEIVTVKAGRTMPALGEIGEMHVEDKFRNPLPMQTAMNFLGMPAGPCRRPLGKMSKVGAMKVRSALLAVWHRNPEVLMPVQEFFSVDIDRRLKSDELWVELAY